MKSLTLIVAFFISGCAPHFYEAESVTLTANSLAVTQSGNLSDDCMVKKIIPKNYILIREGYRLEFEVVALQVGIKLGSEGSDRMALIATDMRDNEPRITRISTDYAFYVPARGKEINVLVSNNGVTIGNETLELNSVTCRAVTMDAI